MEIEELIKKLINSNLKQVHRDTKIPYDRMFKWTKGKGRPKKVDFDILSDYFNTGTSSKKSDSDHEGYVGDKERIITILKNSLKEKDERLMENEKLYTSLIAEKDERLKDKDVIIATKDEALMLWKEKAIEYEKKISTGAAAMGNEGHVHSTKRSGK